MTGTVTKPSPRDRALNCLGQLPPFPPVLTRVIATLAREDVSFSRLGDLLEKDTVLAGHVLRLVNSAIYGLSGTVNSVRHAVSLLGVAKLRNATLSLSVARMWNHVKTAPGWSMARFNLHSVAVAILADLLAQKLPVIYPEGAFTAGLFHDLGHLLIAVGLPQEYGDIDALVQLGAGPLSDCQEQVLGVGHADLSAEALAVWNLPIEIQTAVRYHQAPDADPTPAGPGQIRLSRIIAAADDCAHQRGLSIDALERPAGDGQSAIASLGSDRDPAMIMEEFDREFNEIRRYF